DQKYFNAMCQSRREQELSFEISDLIDHLMRIQVIDPIPEFTVLWDDLNEPTRAERLGNAKTMEEINAQSVNGDRFTGEEVREAAGYDPLEDEDALDDEDPDADDAEDETESADPAK